MGWKGLQAGQIGAKRPAVMRTPPGEFISGGFNHRTGPVKTEPAGRMFCPRLFLIVGIVVHDLLEDLTVVAGVNGTHGQILEEADDVDRAADREPHRRNHADNNSRYDQRGDVEVVAPPAHSATAR